MSNSLAKLINFRGGVKHTLSIAGATLAVLTLSSAANAATVVLDFTDNSGTVTTFQETAGTATATFSNSSTNNFNFGSGGLTIGSGTTLSFDVSFDQDVELLSYISVLNAGSISFDITGPGVSSLGNGQTSNDFIGQPLLLAAGETYTVTGNFPGAFGGTVFGSWTINDSAVVPEPLTILGAGTAIAFGGAFKRKLAKKNKK
ncbi:MAG: PEP-CTERM sorting domain-containing protein [Crocosphaera sp.]|nr:PEP-CTERM sorting domain-containing protein [Crocosphaera sp.]